MYFFDQPIVQDFDHFLAYFEALAPLPLTKRKGRLRAADLLALNEKMPAPVEVTKSRPTQKDFLLLNTFFYIGLGAELFNVRQERKGPKLSVRQERTERYRTMNADERYGFLLQSFWCYMDWEMAFERGMPFEMSQLVLLLEKGTPKNTYTFQPPGRPMLASRVMAELLRAFGLFEYTLSADTAWHNNTFIGLATLTLTKLGQKILPALLQERPFYLWGALDPYMTKSRFEGLYGPIDPKEEEPLELVDFFAAFQPAFPDLEITTQLYPVTQKPVTGELQVKVLLSLKCYRVIRISAAASLEELHEAIQAVFDFDNDHLYAFFLNGTTQYQAGNVLADPRGNVEEPEYPADLISLGEIGIYPGKELLYLFDFGDNWHFLIQILAIDESTEIDNADTFKLVETKGEAPEQYPDWEE